MDQLETDSWIDSVSATCLRGPVRIFRVSHFAQAEEGGCSETSKIIEKITDLLKYFFDVSENDKIFQL